MLAIFGHTVPDTIFGTLIGCCHYSGLSLLGWLELLINQLGHKKYLLFLWFSWFHSCNFYFKYHLCIEFFCVLFLRLVMVTGKVTFGWLLHNHIWEFIFENLWKQTTYMYITFGGVLWKCGHSNYNFKDAKKTGSFHSDPHKNSCGWKQPKHKLNKIYFIKKKFFEELTMCPRKCES